MATVPAPLARLIQELVKLPGIGEKTATRLAFHLLRTERRDVEALAEALAAAARRPAHLFDLLCADRQRSVRALRRPAARRRRRSASSRNRRTSPRSSAPAASTAATTCSAAPWRRSTASVRTTCVIAELLRRLGGRRARGDHRHQPDHRGRGDRALSGAPDQAARRAGHAHRPRPPDGCRRRVRRHHRPSAAPSRAGARCEKNSFDPLPAASSCVNSENGRY